MTLRNYRDLSSYSVSTTGGFQYEFYCNNCTRIWKSPFKPYGQISGFFSSLAPLLGLGVNAQQVGGSLGDAGMRRAGSKALEEAIRQAETRYFRCTSCKKEMCEDCFDANRQLCVTCVHNVLRETQTQAGDRAGAAAGGAVCPNCSTPGSGGRFCPECGFDMASTHKSCPSCGVMVARAARFCTDCGHGF
jgi:Double zinc ribbon